MRKRLKKHSNPEPLLLVNIGQLLTLYSSKPGPRLGLELRELGSIKNAAVLCAGGKIVSVGSRNDALRDSWLKKYRRKVREIDCSGKVVLPGFVDSHTHPAFVSPRLVDFEKRIVGATYEQIAEAGGGIRSSVEGVRRISKSKLAEKVLASFDRMLANGTTTVEAKSGYGLSVESELKSLAAIAEAAKSWPGTVAATLLGAHVIPSEYRDKREEYVTLIREQMIPKVARRKLAQFVDVFCDRGAFDEAESLQILQAAQKYGLQTRAHVSQLTRTSLEQLLRNNVSSLDHLDHVDDADIALLAQSNTVATLVPGANYFLGLKDYPPARKLIDAGVAVALATDYNPGSSPTSSMSFVLSLACTQLRMSPAEAISAATINGAWALRMQQSKGSIEPGKDADLAIFGGVSDYRELAYWIAENQCEMAIANGMVFSGNEGT